MLFKATLSNHENKRINTNWKKQRYSKNTIEKAFLRGREKGYVISCLLHHSMTHRFAWLSVRL
jgi:hypothetical protein